MAPYLQTSSHGHSLVLSLNAPLHCNGDGTAICAAGVEALNAADSNGDIRCVVLHWQPSDSINTTAQTNGPTEQHVALEALHSWIETVHGFPKPVVAALEGPVQASGCALALACDGIVASQTVTLEPGRSDDLNRPAGAAQWALARALPRQLATELLLTTAPLPATRLLQLGLVNRICAPGQALHGALALAEAWASLDRATLARTKELLHDAHQRTLPEQLALERSLAGRWRD